MSEADINERINECLARARAKNRAGDYEGAVRELKTCEVVDPDNPEILYQLGVNYCRLGLPVTAGKYFDRLINASHTFVDVRFVRLLRAYCLILEDKCEEAVPLLELVLKDAPHDCAALNMKGYCLAREGRTGEAASLYRTVLSLDSSNRTAQNSLAYLLAETGGDLDEALALASQVHETNPKHPAYLDTIGYVHLKRGEIAQARRYLMAALELSPLSDEIIRHLRELQERENERGRQD